MRSTDAPALRNAPAPDLAARAGGSPRRASLASRLAWSQRSEPARRLPEDRAAMAQVLAYLLGLAGAFVLVSLALPEVPGRDATALAIAGAGAWLAGLVVLAGFDRLPLAFFYAVPAIGSLLVGIAAYYGGEGAVGAYGFLFFFFAALAACYFFRPRVALLHLGLAATATVVLFLLRDHPAPRVYQVIAAGTLSAAGLLLVALRAREERLFGRLESAARTDPLTALANRRALEERFDQELQRAARLGHQLALVVLDLDRFKGINDRYGHHAGDDVLVEVAGALRASARQVDTVARTGGEEFALLLPDASGRDAYEVAERLRHVVQATFAAYEEPLTASCGVASFPEYGTSPRDLMRAADRALYEAKDLGRNRSILLRPRLPAERGAGRGRGHLDVRVATLLSIAEEVDRRKGGDAETWRVGLYAGSLARRLGLPADRAEQVRLAAQLRDVGEIGIAEEIFQAPDPLGEGQWEEVRKHPEIGARMVAAARLDDLGSWVRCHHERPDGGGYPRGLAEGEIPIEARIVAVADAYAAMQEARAHRPPLPADRARSELRDGAGSQFDPRVVDAFLRLGSGSDGESAGDAASGSASRIEPVRDRLAEVGFERRGDVVVARLEGDVDGSNAADLGVALPERVPNNALGLVLDLSAATFLDSAGIHLLFDLGARLQRRRQQLRIVVPEGSPIGRVLQLAGVETVAPVERNVDAATSGIESGPD